MVVKTIAGAYASFQTKGGNGQQPMLGFPAGKRTSGYRDGVHSLFRSPSAIIVGPRSELIVADTMNNCIRGLRPPSVGTSSWIAYTICGQAYPGHADGNSEVALFDQPVSLCWGVNRNSFFVADRGNACVRQVELSYGADLLFSYASVRTIEIGGVRRAPRSVQGDWLQQPLGIECIFQQKADAEHAGTPQLVVCDGESNTIKMTPLDQLMHRDSNAEKCFNTTKFSEIETVYSTSPQSRSDPRSWGSSVESLSYVLVFLMLS
ncbi:unnamed protein product [Phytophthora lilii]|uniref:Unnamed protein product n=1 Tax=Phytophthora lilii TaxID=2077276 RepID=A0A9W6WRS5_9STRA|nr:unnamed protein product [Phytophthora lilii]